MPRPTAKEKAARKAAEVAAAAAAAAKSAEDRKGDSESSEEGTEVSDSEESFHETGEDPQDGEDDETDQVAAEHAAGGDGPALAAGGGGAELAAGGGSIVEDPVIVNQDAHGPPAEHKHISKKKWSSIKEKLRLFALKVRDYTKDEVTEFGRLLLEGYGEVPTPLDPLPEDVLTLLDALQGNINPNELERLDPSFFDNLASMGFDAESIVVATAAVNTILVTRHAIERGRLTAFAKQHATKQIAGGIPGTGDLSRGAGGGLAAPSHGPATSIQVEFKTVDKDAHKDRSDKPPTVVTAQGKEMLKGALIAILGGNWSKAVELTDLYARTFGTHGVASHILLSARKSLTDATKEGAFQYGEPGNASSAALTVQVGGGAAQGADGGLLPLSRKFNRSDRYAAEDKLLEDIKAGTVLLIGSKRTGNNLTAALAGNSHRNLYARALLQERALYTLLDVVLTVRFPEAQMVSEVKALVHAYRQALSAHTEDEANRLATASEFGTGLTAETLILAKSSCRFVNVATNFMSEYARIVDDTYQIHYLHKISALPQSRRKTGEDATTYYQRLENLRSELRVLTLPSDIDFEALGFSVDTTTGIPKIVSSSALIIKKVVDYLYAELPRLVPDSRVQSVITAEVFADARRGRLTVAQFQSLLRELNAQRIATHPPSETQDATGNTDGLPQHGAFAAAVGKPGGGKGGPALVKPTVEPPKPQDRSRPPGRGTGGARTGRSQSPGKETSVTYYGKSITFVMKRGVLGFLQKLHDQSLAFGESLFETDQSGILTSPLKLVPTHSWSAYNGKFDGSDGKTDNDLWAGLMLARDICRPNDKLTHLGTKYSDSTTGWTKAKAVELRGSLTIAGVTDGASKTGKGGGKAGGKGGGKSSGAAESKTAAAASWLDDTE